MTNRGRIFLITIFTCISFNGIAQSADEAAIRNILANQTQSWNQGNLEKFMEGYLPTDSLMFIGKSGLTYGFKSTLSNYKRNYSDTTQMGKLSFELLQVKKLSNEYYFVVGKWFLKRTVGDIGGHYTLLFRKINGEWKIIADHSS